MYHLNPVSVPTHILLKLYLEFFHAIQTKSVSPTLELLPSIPLAETATAITRKLLIQYFS